MKARKNSASTSLSGARPPRCICLQRASSFMVQTTTREGEKKSPLSPGGVKIPTVRIKMSLMEKKISSPFTSLMCRLSCQSHSAAEATKQGKLCLVERGRAAAINAKSVLIACSLSRENPLLWVFLLYFLKTVNSCTECGALSSNKSFARAGERALESVYPVMSY